MQTSAVQTVLTALKPHAAANLKNILKPGQHVFSRVIQQVENNIFLINLKGMQISAQTTAPLFAGEVLNLQVVQINPKIVLKRVDTRNSKGTVSAKVFRKLMENPELQKVLSEGNFTLDDESISRIEDYLEKFREMRLNLSNSEKREMISLLESTPLESTEKNIRLILPLVKGFEPLSKLLKSLIEAFDNSAIKNKDIPELKELKAIIDKIRLSKGILSPDTLGLLREKLIAGHNAQANSLKDILLRLIQQFRNQDGVQYEILSKTLSQIESLQLLHHIHRVPSEDFVLLPWFYEGEHKDFSRVFRYYGDNNGKGETAVYLRTSIPSQKYGDIEALFRLWEGKIDLDLIISTETIRRRLSDDSVSLQEYLLSRGVPLQKLRVLSSAVTTSMKEVEEMNSRLNVII